MNAAEDRVRERLKARHACCSPREVRAVLDLLAEDREGYALYMDKCAFLSSLQTHIDGYKRAAAALRALP